VRLRVPRVSVVTSRNTMCIKRRRGERGRLNLHHASAGQGWEGGGLELLPPFVELLPPFREEMVRCHPLRPFGAPPPHPGSPRSLLRGVEWGEERVMSGVRIMGILNVTPDSFSGDGILEADKAISQGLAMAEAGADIVDVGGESTRPGHTPISAGEEITRVVPVVRALAKRGLTVSIDTYKLEVAEAALQAGARIVNDIWGLRRAPGIAQLAAEHRAGLVLMHNQESSRYVSDLMSEIKERLRESAGWALQAGVPAQDIMLDPGIGFGKTAEQNMIVLRRLSDLQELGFPILVGPSKKSFLGRVLGQDMPMRAWGTAAVVAACILRGADVVRVHDVREMMAVAQTAEALR
jgi:dihydropteroate synthase